MVIRSAPAIAVPLDERTNVKNINLLIQLRWIAVVGQVLTIGFVHFLMGITLPLIPMVAVLCGSVFINVVSQEWLRRKTDARDRELLLLLLMDVAALTAQLYLSGGATNPFVSLYLLQVTLGAMLLDSRSTWVVVIVACLSFAGLIVFHRPLALPDTMTADLFQLHIIGTLICFALDAALIVVFMTRIARNLRERDNGLASLRQQAAEEDHIVRMGLLASGAAHELGTPLASLSVILSDWRRMPALASDPELMQEIAEMQADVQRCKTIVTGILMSAGDMRGEAPVVTSVNDFFGELADEWRMARSNDTLVYENRFGEDMPIVSDSALKQMIFNVLDNASEVSPLWVRLGIERDGDVLQLKVSDMGPGFDKARLAGFGKPYNSSKGRPGRGLGLFLVVNAVRKLGGTVVADNRPVGGAVVTLSLPLSALAIGARKHVG
ncbi:HAMP domain-containing histidine kinase [Tardiphaga alba]|uniref:histidine kinase n=1 Tax=Tardiphaga alba TaxID=340268 RepID=A0ABX8AES5_9BRAD|nr:ATP-binding protein [Tardiphaga alba]QUS42178.1 HAMP domain-containing histidine kinase [Tardiphaga alba]